MQLLYCVCRTELNTFNCVRLFGSGNEHNLSPHGVHCGPSEVLNVVRALWDCTINFWHDNERMVDIELRQPTFVQQEQNIHCRIVHVVRKIKKLQARKRRTNHQRNVMHHVSVSTIPMDDMWDGTHVVPVGEDVRSFGRNTHKHVPVEVEFQMIVSCPTRYWTK